MGKVIFSDTFYRAPKGGVSTYGVNAVEIRPQKEEIHCRILLVGFNLIDHTGGIITLVSDISVAKFISNSVILTEVTN